MKFRCLLDSDSAYSSRSSPTDIQCGDTGSGRHLQKYVLETNRTRMPPETEIQPWWIWPDLYVQGLHTGSGIYSDSTGIQLNCVTARLLNNRTIYLRTSFRTTLWRVHAANKLPKVLLFQKGLRLLCPKSPISSK